MASAADTLEAQWGNAAGTVLTLLRTAEGRVAYAQGQVGVARALLTKAVVLARVSGDASHLVLALTHSHRRTWPTQIPPHRPRAWSRHMRRQSRWR